MDGHRRDSTDTRQLSRRSFLKTTAAAATFAAAGHRAFAQAADNPAGANDRIGVGVIGCGGRGKAHLGMLNKLKESGAANIEIVAVCDVYRPRMQAAADAHKAKGYMDHRELLADPNVDLVCIATPDHIHGYQAIDALRAGKDVYCEKPVTHWRQFELTKQLNEEVKKSGRVLQLGTQAMSDPAWQRMRELVKEGIIGQVIHAECGYFRVGDWGERGMPIDDPNAQPGPDLNWEAFLGDAPKRDFDVSRFFRWRMYEDYSGGPATDLFPHSLTPTAFIIDVGMPTTVVATGGKFRYPEREVPDTYNSLIDYDPGLTVALLGTQGNAYPATGFRGSGGRVPVIRGWEGTLTLRGDEVVQLGPEGSDKPVKTFPIDGGEDVERHWLDLFDACKAGRQPNAPMELGYRVQTALHMGILSMRSGKVAHFDNDKQQIVV